MLMNRIPPPPSSPHALFLYSWYSMFVRNYLGYVDNFLSSICGQNFRLGKPWSPGYFVVSFRGL